MTLLPVRPRNDCDADYIQQILRGPPPQDDPQLVKWVKSQLVAPSRLPYNLSFTMSGMHKETELKGDKAVISPSQEFILEYVEDMFGDELVYPRLFLEAGAYDGEFLSNTLNLEYEFKWQGILVEANPVFFERLLKKHRKSWAINACLNTKPYPSREAFMMGAEDPKDVNNNLYGEIFPEIEHHISLGSSRLAQFDDNVTQMEGRTEVQCIPLYTIVRAMGITHIDFLSLDVEGAELGILDTVPWDKLSFTVMAIESKHPNQLIPFLDEKGYQHIKSREADHIFISKKNLGEKKTR
ncbi:protein Star-like [Penaeus monodon]|uniref:protein Star-like n=1 Tax=Penaeus monodon TaxID=6687 RepID=UPI0018A759E3|nr:protein Star-like [Penaeus monodon]